MKAIRLRVGIAAAVALALSVSVFVPAPAAADPGQLQAALDDYAAGKVDDALVKLRAYIQTNPSQEEVYGILRDVEDTLLLNAMAKGGDHERYIKYLMSKSAPPASGSMSEGDISSTVKTAVEGSDVDKRVAARVRLRAAGEMAVPHLIGYLGDNDSAKVVNAILALQQIHHDGTMPLIEALSSDNAAVRGYAASVLGQLGDERAGPALLKAAGDADEGVAAKAAEAAEKVGASGDAAAAYVAMGNRFYDREASIAGAFNPMMNMWRWEDGGLARYEVPAYLYANQMAEEHAADALAVDPANADARILLVRSLLAQMAESKARAAHGKEAPEALAGAHAVAKSMGFDAAAGALAVSLDSSDYEVAAAAVGLMAENYGNESLDDTALPAALEAPDRRLSFAAAIAALHMSPAKTFRNADKVAGIAAGAASSDALRQVLVIDDNNETRSTLVSVAAEANMIAAGERLGAVGANRAKSSPTMDVIVIRANLGEGADTVASQRLHSSLAVIDELRNDPRTKDMRILVLIDEEGARAATLKEFFSGKYGDGVAGFLMTPLVDSTVVSEIQAAAGKGDVGPDQARANATAAAAANAFAAVDPNCDIYDLSVAVEALSGAVANGATDDIKMAAINGLGNVRAGGGDALLAVLNGGSDEMKVAAAKALGSVLSTVDGTDAQIDGLIAAAAGDGDLAAAALAALGQVRNISPEKRLEIFRAHRLNVASKGN